MAIEENDAFQVFQSIDTLPEDVRPRAASMLSDYRKQQETAGLPLWPAQEKAKQDRRQRMQAAFDNPLELDKDDGSFLQADRIETGLGDRLRKREASILWLADRYGADEADVRERLDFYKADAAGKWGTGLLDDLAFFAKAKGEVDAKKAKLEALNVAAEAATASALNGGNDLADFAAWQLENEHLPEAFGEARKVWSATRKTILDKLGPDGMAAAKRGVRALQESTGVSQEADAWMNKARRDLVEIKARDPEKYKLVLAAMQLLGASSPKDDKGMVQGVAEKFGRSVETIAAGAVEATQIGSARLADMGVTNAEDPEALAASIRAGIDVDADLRDLAAGVIDPVKSARDGILRDVEEGIYTTAGSLPYMLGVAIPGGQAAVSASFTADAYRDFRRAGWNGADAESAALASGVLQGAFEKASEVILKVPGVAGVFAKFGVKPGSNWATQFLLRSGLRAGVEVGEEVIQEATTPFIQELAASISASVPDRPEGQKLRDVMAKFFERENFAPLLISVLPLGMIGAGLSTSRDMDIMNDAVTFFGEQEAARIMAESDPAKRDAMIREKWLAMSPDEIAKASRAGMDKQVARSTEAARAVDQASSKGLFPRIRADTNGWSVEDLDTGSMVRVGSRGEAIELAYSGMSDKERQSAEAMAQMADEFLGDRSRSEAFEISKSEQRLEDEVKAGRVTQEQVREAAQLYGQLHGLTAEEARIEALEVLGNNLPEENEGVREYVSRIHGGGNLITVIHEGVHGRWNAGLKNGHYSQAQGLMWVRMAEQASGVQFLPVSDDAAVSSAMLDEAITEIVSADVIGRRKDVKQHFSPGLISRGISAFALSQRAEAKQAGKLAVFLKSWKGFWGKVLRNAKALQKARKEGKIGEDFDAFLDDLLGAEPQVRYEAQAAREAADMASTVDNAPFSLRGISESEAKTPMTIYRAGDADEKGIKPWASFTPEKETAEAYLDNPGFGGSSLRAETVAGVNDIYEMGRPSVKEFRKLAERIGLDSDVGQDWFDNGWQYPWEESSKVKRLIEDSGIDAIQYTDDFPAGATTIVFTREPELISDPNTPFSLRSNPQDAEYLAAVEAGDMETAQKLVDVSAKAAGYNVGPVWHYGAKGISEFRPFAQELKIGDKTEAQVDSFIRRAKEGQLIGVMDFRAGTFFTPQRGSYSSYGPQEYGVYLKVENAAKRINGERWKAEIPGKPFDAIMMDMDGDGIVKEIAIIDPAKIKSADPVTRDESGNVIPLSQRFNEASEDIRFSLGPRSLAAVADTVLASKMRSPEFREGFYTEARRRLAKLRTDGEWKVNSRGIASRRVGFDSRMAGVRDPANIEAERKFRFRSRQRELIDAGMLALTPETLAAYDAGVMALDDSPLVSAMLNDNGKLMSKTTAQKLGKLKTDGKGNAGDYDSAPRLPAGWYGKDSGIMPDVMAQALYEQGLLKDAYPDTLWEALRSAIDSTKAANAAFDKARAAVRKVETDAAAQARKESDQWAKDETAKIPTQEERQMMALRTLDAILSAFPPEVRGRVGGFVKLASLNTDKAREAEIERRLLKLDDVVESEARKYYAAKIEKLFKRFEPKRETGKKPVGKLDPDAQELVDAARSAIGYDDARTRAELAAIDSMLAEDGITYEKEIQLERQRELVQLFGDLDNAESARMESAALALEDTASEGWAKWKIQKLMERERRTAARESLIADTGKSSLGKERDKQNKWAKTTFGKAFSALLNVSSFSELLRFEFGEKSQIARQLEDQERAAAYAYEDAMQAFGDRVGDFFAELGGSRLAGEQLRFDLAQPTLTVGTGDNERSLSQLQGIQALLMWQQEDGRRHMEGEFNESAQPSGKWHYGEEWIKDLESKLSPQAYEVKAFLEQLYSEEYGPLNAIYRQRHGVNLPKNERYSPITVQPMQAKAGEMVDPVSGFAVTGSIMTPGGLRSRNKRAVAEPRFDDAVQIFLGHSRQMEHWKAYYDFAMEAQAILLNREVTNAVESKGSTQAVTVLKKWVDQFAQGGSRDAQAGLEISSVYFRLSGRAARVALLGRISTLLIQSAQLAAASVKMPVGSYIKRLGLLLSGNLDYTGAVQSPFMQRRYKTAPPIVQQALAGVGNAERPGVLSSTTPRILGNALSGADALFTGGTYAMILDYHRTVTGPAMGLQGAELEAFARNEAERDTEAVAQPVRAGTRSIFENTLTSPLAKTGFAFASEARQKAALFAWSAYNAKSDPVQTAKVAFLTFIVGGLVSQVLKNLWREAKDDDDEKMWSAERLAKATLAGPLHGVPGVSELMGDPGLFSGFAWSMGGVKKIATKAMDDDLDEVTMRDIENALSAAGYFNDTAAGIAGLSHLGFDFAKILQALGDGED